MALHKAPHMAPHTPSDDQRLLVMLCTASRGGMRAVVEGYQQDGLFERYNIRWIATHDEGSALKRLGLAARAWATLLGLLLRGRVAALHTHMAMYGSFWRKSVFNATARAFGVPVIAHLHGSEFKTFYARQPAWRQRLIAGEFTRCRQVLVLSPSWADFVRGIAAQACVTVLPNWVRVPERPLEATPDEPSSPSLPGSLPTPVQALFMGVVGTRKGVYDLLPALALARQSAPGLALVLGGNGEVDAARARAEALGLGGHARFLGWVAGADKARALAAAQIYVLPSHNEGLPVSILEAMAQGLPIIATRVGGIPELVRHGIDGLLVEPGDVPALAQALATMANDAALRRRCGDAGRARVAAHYSREAVMPVLEAVYADALRARPHRV
jgi:glycosyltransferase involved in cell wall biosynthesis